MARPDQASEILYRKDADKQYKPALALTLLLLRRRKAFHWLGSAWLACRLRGACMSPSTVLSIYLDHVCSHFFEAATCHAVST